MQPSPVLTQTNIPLAVDGLVKNFGSVAAVDGVTFEVGPGEVLAFLGPNGAGKSTTIECCQGLQAPDSGTIHVFGEPSTGLGPEIRARVGVMFQDGGLPASGTPARLLPHLSSFYENPRDHRELVDLLGIDSFANTTVRRLSGGQRQRVALAAALLPRPELVFLDEPTAGLDPQSRAVVTDIIRSLREDGVSVVLTTHDMADAEFLSDRILIMDRGTVLASGTAAELRGGDLGVLEVTTASALPGRILGLLPELREVSSRTYRSAPLEWDRAAACVGILHREGIEPVSLAYAPRTLEDVFLDLTGRNLR